MQGSNKSNLPWLILVDATQYHSVQDRAKLKAALDIEPDLRAQYTFDWWSNASESQSSSYLRRADGTPFYSRVASIAGTNPIVKSMQNIDRIQTQRLEPSADLVDAGPKGLDIQGGLTHTNSRILAISSYVTTPATPSANSNPRCPKGAPASRPVGD